MIELTETSFRDALKDTLSIGAEQERERIINLLNNDAVLQMNLSAQWLGYIVEMIENV